MMSPKERYQNDPDFKYLVDTMEAMIHRAEFSPSELRMAALLASINYEMLNVRHRIYVHEDAEKAFEILKKYEETE